MVGVFRGSGLLRRAIILTGAATLVLGPPASAAPLQHIGNWEASQEVNALTDAKSFSFIMESADSPRNMLGIQKSAALTILCRPDSTLFLAVNWPDFIQATDLGSPYSSVAWRFDERPMQTGRWLLGDHHDLVSLAGNDAGGLIAALAGAHRFIVGITGRQGQQTATFDLSGSDQLPALLASNCNIDLASPKIAASNFAPPPIPVAQVGPEVSFASDQTPEVVLTAARKLLLGQGFTMAEDQHGGVLMTQLAPYPITVAMADCGSMIGIPFIIDRRAHTQLEVIVRAAEGKVSISTAMWGVYQAGKDRPLVCKTKLTFEKALADQLKAAL